MEVTYSDRSKSYFNQSESELEPQGPDAATADFGSGPGPAGYYSTYGHRPGQSDLSMKLKLS